ncbi:hypothetical protein [Rhodococcus indonesiensis]|uniref:hypothetical protein n=1 Tax=Rhodococcus indonesiensis TaxID=3055869 RepID=UPI0039F73A8F
MTLLVSCHSVELHDQHELVQPTHRQRCGGVVRSLHLVTPIVGTLHRREELKYVVEIRADSDRADTARIPNAPREESVRQ